MKRVLVPQERGQQVIGSSPRILEIGKFYSPYAGGIETHLEQLCSGLRGFAEVEVIVANTGPKTVRERLSEIPIYRAGTLTTVANAPISPGMIPAIRRADADIVHIHWPNPMAILAYLASGHRGKLVVTYHSDVVRQRAVASFFQPLLDLVLSRCAAIIATSANYVETSPVLSRFRHLCHVVPYGIATERFASADHQAVRHLKRKYGPRLVLTVGRLVYYKGFEYLIRAMQSVNGRALIVGEGPLEEKLRRLAASRGVADRVVFVGGKCGADLIPYFHAADVFVLPSIARSEAFGIVQLEAMACGKPVINTNLDSGVPSVSLDGVTGLTVPPADSKLLAEAINKLLDDDDLRKRYGKAGRKRVGEEFRLKTMVERTVQLYARILQPAATIDQVKRPLPQKEYAAFSKTLDQTPL